MRKGGTGEPQTGRLGTTTGVNKHIKEGWDHDWDWIRDNGHIHCEAESKEDLPPSPVESWQSDQYHSEVDSVLEGSKDSLEVFLRSSSSLVVLEAPVLGAAKDSDDEDQPTPAVEEPVGRRSSRTWNPTYQALASHGQQLDFRGAGHRARIPHLCPRFLLNDNHWT